MMSHKAKLNFNSFTTYSFPKMTNDKSKLNLTGKVKSGYLSRHAASQIREITINFLMAAKTEKEKADNNALPTMPTKPNPQSPTQVGTGGSATVRHNKDKKNIRII